MKSKELIRQLQELDPTGEIEVNCAGGDIYFVDKLPAYYDGISLQVLIRDESKAPYYDVVGMKEVREGWKLELKGLSLESICWEVEDVTDLILEGSDRFKEQANQCISEHVKCGIDIKRNHFNKYIGKKINDLLSIQLTPFIVDYMDKFFDENPKLIRKDFDSIGSSINDKEEKYWDDCIDVIKDEEYNILKLQYIEGFENKNYNVNELKA